MGSIGSRTDVQDVGIVTKRLYVSAARKMFSYLKNVVEAALLRFNECKTLKYSKSKLEITSLWFIQTYFVFRSVFL